MLESLLFALAVIGHAYLLTVVLNVVYSRPISKRFLKLYRLATALAIIGGAILFTTAYGISVTAVLQQALATGSNLLLAAYLVVALGMACVVLPLVTIRRWLRRDPGFVQSATAIIDVAKELGERPIGDGKNAHQARYPFNDIFRVEFTTLTVELPNLPAAWDGLTLLQFSDLHFYGSPSRDYYDFVVRHCMNEGVPDLLLITGDLVDKQPYIAWIEEVFGQMRWKVGAFAILGNHDWWQDDRAIRESLRSLGMRVVSNAWEQTEVRGEALTVIGHEGPWFRPAPDMSDCPTEGFRLLLSHTPDNINWARRHQVALMLSGHNHGGQVRVPLFGSIFSPSKYSRHYDMGTFWEPPTLLHVNRGLSGKEPIRFRCRPQVTRIVLKASRTA